jgi:hypothetical protein
MRRDSLVSKAGQRGCGSHQSRSKWQRRSTGHNMNLPFTFIHGPDPENMELHNHASHTPYCGTWGRGL